MTTSRDPLTAVRPVLAATASHGVLKVHASTTGVARCGSWTVAGWSPLPGDWIDSVCRAYAAGRRIDELWPLTPWSVVAWDDATGVFHAQCDGGAGPGLIWWHEPGGRLVIASHVAPVVMRAGSATGLDPSYLVGQLMLHDPPTGTPFRGVHRLPPGWELRWRPGNEPKCTRWWRPEEIE
ncbi:MAG: hypothetical protein WCP28_11290, partial [Actinomycetes bacterium]